MDYIKEIERLEKAQAQRLGVVVPQALRDLGEDDDELSAKEKLERSLRVRRDNDAEARSAKGGARRQQPQQATADAAATRAAAMVGGNVLLIPAIFLVLFGIAGVEDAWNGTHVQPVEALFVVIPVLAALFVLRIRRHVLRSARPLPAGTRRTPVPQVIAGSIRAVFVLGVILFIGAMFASEFFPAGLPVLDWVREWEAGGWEALMR